MSDDTWLRDELETYVEGHRDAGGGLGVGRFEAVAQRRAHRRARRRDRTRVVVGAAAVVAAVAAAPVVIGALGEPDGPAMGSGVVAGEFECEAALPTAADYPGGELPEGPIAARLCSSTYDVTPTGVATTGLEEIVGVVNDAEPYDPANPPCNSADVGYEWVMAFQYPDGTVRAIDGETSSCIGGIDLPGQFRGTGRDAIDVYALFRDGLAEGTPARR